MSTEKYDDFSMPLASIGEKVLHPVSGKPVTDPIKKLAVLEDAYIIADGEIVPVWPKLIRPRLLFRAVPKYFGFTAEEMELYQKLSHEAFITVDHAAKIIGFEGRQVAVDWIWDRKIPLYSIAGRQVLFTGDLVRAVQSVRIPTEGNDGLVWKRFTRSLKGRAAHTRWKRAIKSEDPAQEELHDTEGLKRVVKIGRDREGWRRSRQNSRKKGRYGRYTASGDRGTERRPSRKPHGRNHDRPDDGS